MVTLAPLMGGTARVGSIPSYYRPVQGLRGRCALRFANITSPLKINRTRLRDLTEEAPNQEQNRTNTNFCDRHVGACPTWRTREWAGSGRTKRGNTSTPCLKQRQT